MGYSGAGGKHIDEKNQKQKISWHCPFNSAMHIAHWIFTTWKRSSGWKEFVKILLILRSAPISFPLVNILILTLPNIQPELKRQRQKKNGVGEIYAKKYIMEEIL